MKPQAYRKAWDDMKDTQIQKYIHISKQPMTPITKAVMSELKLWLLQMDELDGTYTFQNVLHDLEAG
ncbi:hypothetical protein V760_02587 [Staphylococcus aureus F23613]|uniref:hypothetical protein n=1 Tax=Staphylococcus aureus TaxID=1280 RepID=UPI00044B490A|nr:hypothetical protein [Staphylococcus aureus]EXQ67343.1 hypothetical protein V760_02587 [Staphylococcus aureus F23613]